MADGRTSDGRFAAGNKLAPGGSKPRGPMLAPLIRKRLNEIHDKATGQTVAERIVEVVSALALEGERWAVEWIGDRIDGKASQSVEVSGENLAPFHVLDLSAFRAAAASGDGDEG